MSKEREESHFWKLSKKIIESPFLEIPTSLTLHLIGQNRIACLFLNKSLWI